MSLEKFLAGLQIIQSYEDNCQIFSEGNRFCVCSPPHHPSNSLLERICPSDYRKLEENGFKWKDINSSFRTQGFVFQLNHDMKDNNE
jgi:hypothetical protein